MSNQMDPIMQSALQAMLSNPKMQQNPMAQQFMSILQNNDVAAGEAMANQILQQMDMDRNTAYMQAQNGLGQMFSNNFRPRR